eukprot:350341-Chlamydomonas_euryale.AAC.2
MHAHAHERLSHACTCMHAQTRPLVRCTRAHACDTQHVKGMYMQTVQAFMRHAQRSIGLSHMCWLAAFGLEPTSPIRCETYLAVALAAAAARSPLALAAAAAAVTLIIVDIVVVVVAA